MPFSASSECRNLVCTYNNKSRHTLFRMFPIGKFNHIHRYFSWRDQNVSGINSICSICLRGACWTACAALIWSILPVEKMLAAHSAERWARRNEPCRSYGLQLTVPKKNWRPDRYSLLKTKANIFKLKLQFWWWFDFYAKMITSQGQICLSFTTFHSKPVLHLSLIYRHSW